MAFEGSEVVFTIVFERLLEALERPLGGPLGNLDLLRPLGAFRPMESAALCWEILNLWMRVRETLRRVVGGWG